MGLLKGFAEHLQMWFAVLTLMLLRASALITRGASGF